MHNIELSPHKQKTRLRWILLLLFIAPSIPVYYLLQTVYTQLENEAYFNARHQAETLVDQIELKLQHLLKKEQNRPIAEYTFFNVMENPLLSETSGVKFSPLSEIPPKTDIKGLVGYFQINTDGSFHLPALPDVGQDNLSGLSLAELESRLKLKQQLRDLLSINGAVEKTDRTTVQNKPIVKNRSRPKPKKQSYRAEFKQEMAFSDDMIKPPASLEGTIQSKKKLADSVGQSSPLSVNNQQKISKTAKKFNTRKEIVQIPDQSMASSYFNRAKQQPSLQLEQESPEETNKDTALKTEETPDSAINVFSFESEVTPLQLILIGQKYFCFYRYVWHDNNRYTQGFIVKSDDFLAMVTQALTSSSNYSSLLFSSKERLLQRIKIRSSEQEYQLYSRYLAMPFQQLELVVNAARIKQVPGALLIDMLAVSIYCIFIIGFIAIYRLGSRQIDLAKQQQNFISAVSHELKTPLTSIRMYGEMLRSGWVSEESKKQKYYDFIFFESERLSRLIANVLQLARLGNHKSDNTEVITTTALSLFKRISSRIETQIDASCFSLHTLQPDDNLDRVDIKVDEDAFFQIIINLVDNAIKFSSNSDCKQIDIGLTVSKKAKHVIFSIRDYGPGIKKDQMKKIFQLFYRTGDELTRTTPGTGIGLALVAQLSEKMNADIKVINKKPGAEFLILLPIILKKSVDRSNQV